MGPKDLELMTDARIEAAAQEIVNLVAGCGADPDTMLTAYLRLWAREGLRPSARQRLWLVDRVTRAAREGQKGNGI